MMNDLQKKYANLGFPGFNTNSNKKSTSKDSNMFYNQLKTHGICYKVLRNNEDFFECKGIINTEESTGRKYIGFEPNSDIKPFDILINPVNEKVYVVEVQTQFVMSEAYQLKAYYQTEYEHNNSESQKGNTIFNITNPTNSIIGTHNVTTVNCDTLITQLKDQVNNVAEDKHELQQIVSLLEKIVNGNIQPEKGMFSNFSAKMEKHSWLTSAIANILLNWLLNPPL